MSVGLILLTVAAVLVFFGVGQRVLDKMRLSDRAALLLLALMFFGSFIPDIQLGTVTINIGGAVIPFGICVYLLILAGTAWEFWRTIIGTLLTAGAVYLLGILWPDEPEEMIFDINYIYGLAGGLLAYLLGRSRRGAFVCGVLGVLLADVAVAIVNWQGGIEQQLVLGGAGVFDVCVIAGIVGVILAEAIGEIIERLTRGNKSPKDRPIEVPVETVQKGIPSHPHQKEEKANDKKRKKEVSPPVIPTIMPDGTASELPVGPSVIAQKEKKEEKKK